MLNPQQPDVAQPFATAARAVQFGLLESPQQPAGTDSQMDYMSLILGNQAGPQ